MGVRLLSRPRIDLQLLKHVENRPFVVNVQQLGSTATAGLNYCSSRTQTGNVTGFERTIPPITWIGVLQFYGIFSPRYYNLLFEGQS